MFKFLFLIAFSLFFSSCSALSYSYLSHTKELRFKVPNDKLYQVKLQNPKVNSTFDACTMDSYTLKDANSVFIEHLSLHSNCKFNAEAFGLFLYEFKENLKLKSLKPIESFTFSNYEFYTYEVDENSIVNFIFIFSPFEDTFIVDFEGKIYQEILQQFNPSYVNSYKTRKRFYKNYDYSLVKMNVFKGYFNTMSEDYSQ